MLQKHERRSKLFAQHDPCRVDKLELAATWFCEGTCACFVVYLLIGNSRAVQLRCLSDLSTSMEFFSILVGAVMIGTLWRWIELRRAMRRRWQEDARQLSASDPIGAYYEAQRRALRNRAQGNAIEYWHWAKVASEVARIQPHAEMDFEVVNAIADQEDAGHR